MGVGLLLYPVRGISASTTMPYRYICYHIRGRDLSTETFALRLAVCFGYDLVFFSFPKADLRKPGLRDLSMGIFGIIVVDSFPVRLLSSTMDATRCSIQQYLKGKAIDSTDCVRLLGWKPLSAPRRSRHSRNLLATSLFPNSQVAPDLQAFTYLASRKESAKFSFRRQGLQHLVQPSRRFCHLVN